MLKVVVDHAPSEADNNIISEGVFASHASIIGQPDKLFSVFLKSESGKMFGGVKAYLDTESVYIDGMWVDETVRAQGYGKTLLEAVEQEGIKNGCTVSTVDTWDFQAEGFYLKNGYERIGEIKNYWLGHSRIFLRKKLK